MSPVIRNDNSHAVYPGGKRDLRLEAGEVSVREGDEADALLALDGVNELGGDEGQSALDAYRAERGPVTTGESGAAKLEREVAEVRNAATLVGTSAPLQRVIGDDQAPLGPPTGTISTKAVEAAKSDAQRAAFGDHEALPGEKVTTPQVPSPAGGPTGDEVHDRQVETTEAVDEVAQGLIPAEHAARGVTGADGEVDLEEVLDDDDDGDGEVARDDAGARTYEDVKGDDLDKLATDRNIEGRSSLKADEIRAALREQDAAAAAPQS